jgi:hypothetical protein
MENELAAKSKIDIAMSILVSTCVVAWQRHVVGHHLTGERSSDIRHDIISNRTLN